MHGCKMSDDRKQKKHPSTNMYPTELLAMGPEICPFGSLTFFFCNRFLHCRPMSLCHGALFITHQQLRISAIRASSCCSYEGADTGTPRYSLH